MALLALQLVTPDSLWVATYQVTPLVFAAARLPLRPIALHAASSQIGPDVVSEPKCLMLLMSASCFCSMSTLHLANSTVSRGLLHVDVLMC